MAIDETKKIDAVSVEPTTREVLLTIIDAESWSRDYSDSHLYLLQEKINTYMAFIENGELVDKYPDALGRKVVIEIISKYKLSEQAQEFFDQAVSMVRGAGFDLKFNLYKEN